MNVPTQILGYTVPFVWFKFRLDASIMDTVFADKSDGEATFFRLKIMETLEEFERESSRWIS